MSGITLVVEDRAWRSHRGLQASLTRAADAARRSAKLKGGFTILLATDRKLNPSMPRSASSASPAASKAARRSPW